MYRWAHKYTDYDNHSREEVFYFNFNKAELLDLEWRTPGGLEQYIKNIVSMMDGQKLADMFKMLIDKSYGIKGPDGREFIKSEEILNHFKFTEAYSDLYMLLATDSTAASAFINGIFPKEAVEEAKRQHEMANKAGLKIVDTTQPSNVMPASAPTPMPAAPPMVEGQQIYNSTPITPMVEGQQSFTPVSPLQ